MPIAWNSNHVAFIVSEPLHAPALSLILGYGATTLQSFSSASI
jgi:hypothetical protein